MQKGCHDKLSIKLYRREKSYVRYCGDKYFYKMLMHKNCEYSFLTIQKL